MIFRNQSCQTSFPCLNPFCAHLANLLTDHRMAGRPIRVKKKNSSLLLKLMIIQTRAWNFVQLPIRNVVQRIIEHVLPRRRLALRFVLKVFPIPVIFLLLHRCTWFKHLFALFNDSFIWIAFKLRTCQEYLVKKWCLFVNIHIIHQFLSHGSHILVFPSDFCTDKYNPHFRWSNIHSFPILFFSFPYYKKLLRIDIPTANRLMDDDTGFVQKVPRHLQFLLKKIGPFVSWKTYSNIWTFSFRNFVQPGSIFQFYGSVSRHCTGCLSVTTWWILQ